MGATTFPLIRPVTETTGIATAHGHISRLRGAHEVGRGDAMTMIAPETTAGVSK